MNTFPTQLTPETFQIQPGDTTQLGNQAIEHLYDRGLMLHGGLAEADIEQIQTLARSPKIVEYCPNDRRRFGDPESWVQKGRSLFTLREFGSAAIVGYAWSGPEPCAQLPDHPITTAFRTIIPGTGKDLVVAVVESTRQQHGDAGIGLETWASNTAAVRTYLRAGAQLLNTVSHSPHGDRILRPTLDTANASVVNHAGAFAHDTRLFMGFPRSQ